LKNPQPESISFDVDDAGPVSGLLQAPAEPRAAYVLAHGAGAGMQHAFMAAVADELASLGVATLRYQFPYMERGRRRPGSPKEARATVRAAVDAASRLLPDVPLFAGGKSYGGRMTSQAQAESPLPGVRGLVFLGFPLHPAGKPSVERADHLGDVSVPMLFVQGTRDKLAELTLLAPLVTGLGERATLNMIEDADHSFHVPVRSGRTDPEVHREMLLAVTEWIHSVLQKKG
jgi:predicted alpha/beta-hydrolase family hydrolase